MWLAIGALERKRSLVQIPSHICLERWDRDGMVGHLLWEVQAEQAVSASVWWPSSVASKDYALS